MDSLINEEPHGLFKGSSTDRPELDGLIPFEVHLISPSGETTQTKDGVLRRHLIPDRVEDSKTDGVDVSTVIAKFSGHLPATS